MPVFNTGKRWSIQHSYACRNKTDDKTLHDVVKKVQALKCTKDIKWEAALWRTFLTAVLSKANWNAFHINIIVKKIIIHWKRKFILTSINHSNEYTQLEHFGDFVLMTEHKNEYYAKIET